MSYHDPDDGRMTQKDWVQIVVMPLVLITVTALLGFHFQGRSEKFKIRLERIMSAQKEAGEILYQVDEALRQLKSNENQMQEELRQQGSAASRNSLRALYRELEELDPSASTLRTSAYRLQSLSDQTRSLGGGELVAGETSKYIAGLSSYLNCLRSNNDPNHLCGEKYEDLRKLLVDVVRAYGRLASE